MYIHVFLRMHTLRQSSAKESHVNGLFSNQRTKVLPIITLVMFNKVGYEKKASHLYSVQFNSVAQSCPTLCDPMNRSTPSLPVHHQLPEFTQTHVHRVSDAIQTSHPLSSPFSSCPQSLPASESFPMSQLFAWGGQSTGVSALASFLPKKS